MDFEQLKEHVLMLHKFLQEHCLTCAEQARENVKLCALVAHQAMDIEYLKTELRKLKGH